MINSFSKTKIEKITLLIVNCSCKIYDLCIFISLSYYYFIAIIINYFAFQCLLKI